MLSQDTFVRLGIIGGGRAAWAFGSSWRDAGLPLAGVHLRAGSTSDLVALLGSQPLDLQQLVAESDLLLVAVSDRAIETAAREAQPRHDQLIFHASGALPGSILPGGRRFSLHPLMSLPPLGAASSLAGSLLVYEGDASTEQPAREIASKLGAALAIISTGDKPLYHAAAVFASNYVAALLDISAGMMKTLGIEARTSVARLAESAIRNWSSENEALRFTGPLVRGDADCVAAHLEALEKTPQLRALYLTLGRSMLDALPPDLRNAEQIRQIRQILGEDESQPFP
jgi:predicted short-subunit dehydrogenase-like oxidoreductase (DUF2520 family)